MDGTWSDLLVWAACLSRLRDGNTRSLPYQLRARRLTRDLNDKLTAGMLRSCAFLRRQSPAADTHLPIQEGITMRMNINRLQIAACRIQALTVAAVLALVLSNARVFA